MGRAGIENGLGIREPVALNTPEFFTLNLKVAYDIPVYKSITLQVNDPEITCSENSNNYKYNLEYSVIS